MQLCLNVQLDDYDAVYIDTEGSFMAERLQEMALAMDDSEFEKRPRNGVSNGQENIMGLHEKENGADAADTITSMVSDFQPPKGCVECGMLYFLP